MLYVRGDKSGGDLERHLRGFRGPGIDTVSGVIAPDCGQFAFEEQPDEVARLIASFRRR